MIRTIREEPKPQPKEPIRKIYIENSGDGHNGDIYIHRGVRDYLIMTVKPFSGATVGVPIYVEDIDKFYADLGELVQELKKNG